MTILIMGLFIFSMSFCAIAADNTATVEDIIVDKTAPNVPTLSGISDDWINTDVTVTVSNISDLENNGVSSGVEKVEYSVGGTSSENVSGTDFTITVSDEGETTVTAKTIDKAGNASEQASGTVKLDKTVPTIDIKGVEKDGVYHTAINPIFSADDNLSGINGNPTAALAKDGGAAEPFTSGTEINAPGTYTLLVTAIDNAGNTATENITFTLGTVTMKDVNITVTAKSPTSMEISWDALDSATGYKVYESENMIEDVTIGTLYIHEDLGVNTLHTYHIVPYNALGDGTESNTASAYTLANIPANLEVTEKTSSTITVTWEANGNPDGTEYSASIDGNTWTGFTADKLTHTFEELTVGRSYTVSVKARNGNQVETDAITIETSTNTAPELTITSPEAGSAYSGVDGHSTIIVTGTVKDVDNDDVTVTAKLKNTSGVVIATESITVEKCEVAKDFSLTFAVTSSIAEGKYSIEVTADDGK